MDHSADVAVLTPPSCGLFSSLVFAFSIFFDGDALVTSNNDAMTDCM